VGQRSHVVVEAGSKGGVGSLSGGGGHDQQMPAVNGEQLPLLKIDLPGRRQVGQLGQNDVVQRQRIAGHDGRLADRIQAEQPFLQGGQALLNRVARKSGQNMRLQLLRAEEHRKMVDHVAQQVGHEGLQRFHAHLTEQSTGLQALFDELCFANQHFGIGGRHAQVDRDPALKRMMRKDQACIGNDRIVFGQKACNVGIDLGDMHGGDQKGADDRQRNYQKRGFEPHGFHATRPVSPTRSNWSMASCRRSVRSSSEIHKILAQKAQSVGMIK
jgi:hypothetical protein